MNLGLSHVCTHIHTASQNNWQADWITEMSPEVIILMNSSMDGNFFFHFFKFLLSRVDIYALFDLGLALLLVLAN